MEEQEAVILLCFRPILKYDGRSGGNPVEKKKIRFVLSHLDVGIVETKYLLKKPISI